MKFVRLLILTILLYSFSPVVFADQQNLVTQINFDKNDNLEIISKQKPDFKAYLLNNPNRLVVDLASAKLADKKVLEIKFPKFISSIRYNQDPKNLRIVFDLKEKIVIQGAKYHKLKTETIGKIVVQIAPEISYAIKSSGNTVLKSEVKNQKIEIGNKNPNQQNAQQVLVRNVPIIVIDAGHGGKDPGTIGGYARTKEKNITLSYAKELAKHLGNTKRYKVYMTRSSDIFIPLKQRVAKARKVGADLFISLHANSAADSEARGFSIYTLSENASDRQSELLAQKENRADIISGINFENAGSDILKTLIDLSQRNSMNHSSRFANISIKSVERQEIDILHNTHRFAGFAVLTAPDMVSVLIELGYLSNRKEERDLNSLTHKRKIVKGLVEAIDEYFKFHNISKN